MLVVELTQDLIKKNGIYVTYYKALLLTAATRSLLVFLNRKFCFHEESLSLAEKTQFAFPQRRVAAKRYS
jgi:hypothetical protein